ncbi:MAG: hypothetical protein ACK5KO_13245, partial [Arachnia sp.]
MGLFIGIGAAVLVVALVVLYLFWPGGDSEDDPDTKETILPSPTTSPATVTSTVEVYFAALTDGDLETIGALSADDGAWLAELTSEAVAQAAAAGPVENLVIEEYTNTADVTYTIKGHEYTAFIDLVNTADGWKISDAASGIWGLDELPAGVTATVNGVAMKEVLVPPGVWELGTDNPFVVFTPNSVVVGELGRDL